MYKHQAKHMTRLRAEGRVKRVEIPFYEQDFELYEYLQNNKPCSRFIKDLIRKHMEEQNG